MYIDAQRRKLGEGDRFAVKVDNRSDDASGQTHWMSADADQVKRIMDILAEGDDVYEITAGDVGKATIQAFGRVWQTVNFIGRILPGDVGKRVRKVRDNANVSDFLTVESDEQRDRRVGKPSA